MIHGARIRQARELREMPQQELAALLSITAPKLARLERGDGTLELTDPEQEQLVGALQLPLPFFEVPVVVGLSEGSIRFRARRTLAKKVWVRAVRETELAHELAHTLSADMDIPAARVPSTPPGTDAEEAAAQARAALGLPADEPIPHVIHVLERGGVWVFEITTRVDSKLDAFSTWAGDHLERPVIAIGDGLSWDRKRMTASHELGHLVMHRSAVDDEHGGRDLEREADRFAAAFLMPRDAAEQELPRNITLSRLGPLKSRWGMSLASLVVRAHTIGRVDDAQKTSLFKQLSARGWRKVEPGVDARNPERPRALRRMAEVVHGYPIDTRSLAARVGRYTADVGRELDRYATAPERRSTRGSYSHGTPIRPAPANAKSEDVVVRLADRRRRST